MFATALVLVGHLFRRRDRRMSEAQSDRADGQPTVPFTAEELARAEADADRLLALVIRLDNAIDADDEDLTNRLAITLTELASELDLGWLDVLASDNLANAAEIVAMISISFGSTIDATADDYSEAAWWGGLQAELVGGFGELDLERAQEIVGYAFQQIWSLRDSNVSADTIWEMSAPLIELEPYWPDMEEVGGKAVLLVMLARVAVTCRQVSVGVSLLERLTADREQLPADLESELLQIELQLALQRGRTDEIELLLRRVPEMVRRSPDQELARQAMAIAVGAGSARGLALDGETMVDLFRATGVPEGAARLRIDAMAAVHEISGPDPSHAMTLVDPEMFDEIADRADPLAEPGLHVLNLVMSALVRLAQTDVTGGRARLERAREGLRRARDMAPGGFADGPLDSFCQLAECTFLLAEGLPEPSAALAQAMHARALSDQSWLMAALWAGTLAASPQTDPSLALSLAVEALTLLTQLRTQLPSSSERERFRAHIGRFTYRAFTAADELGDPQAMAELIELVRSQAMPTASVLPDDTERSLTSLMFEQTVDAVLTDASNGSPTPLASSLEELDDLTLLAPPARIRMPWPESALAATINRVDQLTGRPAPRAAVLTVSR